MGLLRSKSAEVLLAFPRNYAIRICQRSLKHTFDQLYILGPAKAPKSVPTDTSSLETACLTTLSEPRMSSNTPTRSWTTLAYADAFGGFATTKTLSNTFR